MIIVKFTRLDNLRFLSFLDIRNAFQRTLNRAKITTNFSQGYNPHNLVYFCDPDALGIESLADYALIDSDCDINMFLKTFNANAPNGLKMLSINKIEDKIVFNRIFKYASYRFFSNAPISEQKLFDALSSSRIVATKCIDGGTKSIDISGKIHSFNIINDNSFEVVLPYGQEKISPIYLINYLSKILNILPEDFIIKKQEIFALVDDTLKNVDSIFFA